MNILHLWQGTYPWEVRVGKLNRAFLAHGHRPVVLARQASKRVMTEGEVIYEVGSRAGVPVPGNWFWRRALRDIVRREEIDVILVRDLPLAALGHGVAREYGLPLVLDMAEHYPAAMKSWDKYRKGLFRWPVHSWNLVERYERWAVGKCDRIFVVCEEQKERLVGSYGYPRDSIAVVRNVPERHQIPKRGSPGYGFSLEGLNENPLRPLTIGYHGILCRDRSLETLVSAFSIVRRSDPRVRLLLAGGGESEAALRTMAAQSPDSKWIEFTGAYRPEQLKELYSRTDIGVVSLVENEFTQNTLANKFFDYPAWGKPFVFANLDPLRRLAAPWASARGYQAQNPESLAQALLSVVQGLRTQGEEWRLRADQVAAEIREHHHWGRDGELAVQALEGLFFSGASRKAQPALDRVAV